MDKYKAMLSPGGLFVLGIFACYIWVLLTPIRESIDKWWHTKGDWEKFEERMRGLEKLKEKQKDGRN